MYHVMIDLETTGVTPGSGILSIGATVFMRDHISTPALARLDTEFYVAVQAESNKELGLTYDEATLEWWATQSKAAYDAAWKATDAVHISQALSRFSVFISQLKEPVVCWANGAEFDFPILRAAYDKAGLVFPIEFRNVRCYRTLKNLFPYIAALPIESGVKHNAYHDARYQAAHAESMLDWIARFRSRNEAESCT